MIVCYVFKSNSVKVKIVVHFIKGLPTVLYYEIYIYIDGGILETFFIRKNIFTILARADIFVASENI